jgi:hypothetical protein
MGPQANITARGSQPRGAGHSKRVVNKIPRSFILEYNNWLLGILATNAEIRSSLGTQADIAARCS